jgi:DNA-binding NarL/FixJ family response regulator
MYGYLESYAAKGYAFYLIENESDFFALAGNADTTAAFIEDIFFGDKTVGRLDYIRKRYPKLRRVVFSASGRLPVHAAARYASWGHCGYLTLRDSDEAVGESLEAVFRKQQAVPPYLRNNIDEYDRLRNIEPYLTHREIEIVRCVAEGRVAKEIAAVLMLSEKTVRNHLCNIREKFGIHSMVEVLKLAVSKGILPIDELMTSQPWEN